MTDPTTVRSPFTLHSAQQPHPSAAGAYPVLTFLPQLESPTFMWLPPRAVLVVQGIELVGGYQPEAMTDDSPPLFGGGTLHFYNTVLHQPVCLPASATVSLPQAAKHNNTPPPPPSPPAPATSQGDLVQQRAALVEQFQIRKQLGLLPPGASISDLVDKAINASIHAQIAAAPGSSLGQMAALLSAPPSPSPPGPNSAQPGAPSNSLTGGLSGSLSTLGGWASTAINGAIQAVQGKAAGSGSGYGSIPGPALGPGPASKTGAIPANNPGPTPTSESGSGSGSGRGLGAGRQGQGQGSPGSPGSPGGSPGWSQAARLTGQVLGQIATALDPPSGPPPGNGSAGVVQGSDLDKVLHAGQHAPFCINHTTSSGSGAEQHTCYASYMPLDGVTTVVARREGPHHNSTGGVQLYHRDSSSDTANSSLMYSGSVLVCDTINTDCEGLEGAHRTACLIPFLGQLALPAGDSLGGDAGFDFFNASGRSGIGGDPLLVSDALAGNGTSVASPSSTPGSGLSRLNTVVLASVLGGVLPLLLLLVGFLVWSRRAGVASFVQAVTHRVRGAHVQDSAQDLGMPPSPAVHAEGAVPSKSGEGGKWDEEAACHETFSDNHSSAVSSSQPTATVMMSSARVTSSGQGQHGAAAIVVRHLLGAGSYGRVFLGEWEGREVAVKLISHTTAAEAERVGNEVALSMRLTHPNVVRCLYFEIVTLPPGAEPSGGLPCHRFDDSSGGGGDAMHRRALGGAVGLLNSAGSRALGNLHSKAETWIVLELCNNHSLSAHMDAGSLHALLGLSPTANTLADMLGVLSVALDIARGMEYVHGMCVCHGDLSAGNVLLHKDHDILTAKVADFGLSRSLGDGFSAISTQSLGTVLFMPPELMSSGQLRPSADVYSFGILLYCMLAGRLPFPGLRFPEIVVRVTSLQLRPELPHSTPVQLRALAEACWHSNPAARPTFPAVCQQLRCMLEAGACDRRQQGEAAMAGPGVETGGVAALEQQDAVVMASWAQAAAIALM
ncbi:MAG: hypothetical protein WDW36_001292 [Sanguina aurantia]